MFMLVLIYGNLGSGKSTLAKKFCKEENFILIRFDEMMFKYKDRVYSKDDDFLLGKEDILLVYEDMHKLALKELKKGKSVVLESLYMKAQREKARKIAKNISVDFKVVEVYCDETKIKKRLTLRKKEDPQTPGFKLYLEYKKLLDVEDDCIKIDTSSKNVADCYKQLVQEIKRKE